MAVSNFMVTHAGEILFKMLISNTQPIITMILAIITTSDNTLAIFLFFFGVILKSTLFH